MINKNKFISNTEFENLMKEIIIKPKKINHQKVYRDIYYNGKKVNIAILTNLNHIPSNKEFNSLRPQNKVFFI